MPDQFAVTWTGECPWCGVTVTMTGGGIPEEHRPDVDHDHQPARRLGDLVPLRCICPDSDEFTGRIVGLTIEPYRAVVDIDELEHDVDVDTVTLRDGYGPVIGELEVDG